RVVRDGRLVSPAEEQDKGHVATESGQDARAPSDSGSARDSRALRVGDRVRLRTLGSIGIVDRIKDGEAEVRAGSLHLREKLENLEWVDASDARKGPPPVSAAGASTASVSGRTKVSLEEIRRKAASTELHLHSKETRGATSAELNLIGKKSN